MKRILILCSANSIRSPMAEALWKDCLGEALAECEVVSAGAMGSGRLHPMVESVLAEDGIFLDGFSSRAVSQFEGQKFDLVVTLSDEAHRIFPTFPGAVETQHWPMPDPTVQAGDRRAAFRALRDMLRERINAVVAD